MLAQGFIDRKFQLSHFCSPLQLVSIHPSLFIHELTRCLFMGLLCMVSNWFIASRCCHWTRKSHSYFQPFVLLAAEPCYSALQTLRDNATDLLAQQGPVPNAASTYHSLPAQTAHGQRRTLDSTINSRPLNPMVLFHIFREVQSRQENYIRINKVFQKQTSWKKWDRWGCVFERKNEIRHVFA